MCLYTVTSIIEIRNYLERLELIQIRKMECHEKKKKKKQKKQKREKEREKSKLVNWGTGNGVL